MYHGKFFRAKIKFCQRERIFTSYIVTGSGIKLNAFQANRKHSKLEARGQCIPPPRHVLTSVAITTAAIWRISMQQQIYVS